MNTRYRHTLLAGVAAALVAAPLLAAEDPTAAPAAQETPPDQMPMPATPMGQPSDPTPMQSPPMGMPSDRTPMQSAPEHVAPQAGTEAPIDHPLYAKNPKALYDQEVLDADNLPLGRISDIVSDRTGGRIYAVITSGGFLGLGTSKHAVPLDSLQLRDGRIHLQATKDDLAVREEYEEEGYLEVPEDRPISEFSAFETPVPSQ